MDKFALINDVIVKLDSLDVHGISSMKTVIDIVQELAALKNGLAQEDEKNKQMMDELRREETDDYADDNPA